MRIGCDLVHIERFIVSMHAGGPLFLEKIFTTSELAGSPNVSHLAGLFAAKEAIAKAVGRAPYSWHAIIIDHEPSGRPVVYLARDYSNAHAEVSISHDGQYACACALIQNHKE